MTFLAELCAYYPLLIRFNLAGSGYFHNGLLLPSWLLMCARWSNPVESGCFLNGFP